MGQISVSPNPVLDITTVELTLKGRMNVQLFDLGGKLVQDVFNDVLFSGVNEIPLDVSELNTGILKV